jgi:hypothetical protein
MIRWPRPLLPPVVRDMAMLVAAVIVGGIAGALAQRVYGSTREWPIGRSTRYLHAGITFLIRPWIHADLHGGLGSRTAGSPSWLGVGLRQRI